LKAVQRFELCFEVLLGVRLCDDVTLPSELGSHYGKELLEVWLREGLFPEWIGADPLVVVPAALDRIAQVLVFLSRRSTNFFHIIPIAQPAAGAVAV
jgi:hypothetical protein